MAFKKDFTLIFMIDISNHSVDYRKKNINYPETPYKHAKL